MNNSFACNQFWPPNADNAAALRTVCSFALSVQLAAFAFPAYAGKYECKFEQYDPGTGTSTSIGNPCSMDTSTGAVHYPQVDNKHA